MLNYPISVFLDTNIFDSCKYHLDDNSILKVLQKFAKNDKVRLYISNIVLREAEKHIKDATDSAYKVLKSAEKEIRKIISPSMLEGTSLEKYFQLPPVDGIEESTLNKFRDFLKNTNVVTLDNSGVDIEQIIDDYFNSKPPFEEREKKKNEFPDAIIISKLKEKFSKDNPIWIISGDKGFQNAFQGLEGFNSMYSLKELFDMINKQDRIIIYNRIKNYLENSEVIEEIAQAIEVEIENDEIEIDGMDCDRKGICEGFDYDEVYIESISNVGVALSSVDEISDEIVIVSVICNADFSALCSYDDYENSIWDSEEKEYFFLQRGEVREYHHAEFECVLKFSVSGKGDDFAFQLEEISYDLELDQYTRTDREFLEDDDPRFDA
ncbi:PIN domain-containing protein [Anaerosolibacter sp.]|uniref:PIN domain-containing protein n=1 Tax=Anaerosolibacter sp. TaxID=1872527 RepID=UPI0039EFA808